MAAVVNAMRLAGISGTTHQSRLTRKRKQPLCDTREALFSFEKMPLNDNEQRDDDEKPHQGESCWTKSGNNGEEFRRQ